VAASPDHLEHGCGRVGIGFPDPYTLYLNQQVTQRFGELRWQIPTACMRARWCSRPARRWMRPP
jgi:hypothetical protein